MLFFVVYDQPDESVVRLVTAERCGGPDSACWRFLTLEAGPVVSMDPYDDDATKRCPDEFWRRSEGSEALRALLIAIGDEVAPEEAAMCARVPPGHRVVRALVVRWC
jgi:hypothetical protein